MNFDLKNISGHGLSTLAGVVLTMFACILVFTKSITIEQASAFLIVIVPLILYGKTPHDNLPTNIGGGKTDRPRQFKLW